MGLFDNIKTLELGGRLLKKLELGGVVIWEKPIPTLPEVLQRVEYLQNSYSSSSSASTINIGVLPNIYDIVETEVKLLQASNTTYCPIISAYEHAYILYGSGAVTNIRINPAWKSWASSAYGGSHDSTTRFRKWESYWSDEAEGQRLHNKVYEDGTLLIDGYTNLLNSTQIAYTSSQTPYALFVRMNNGTTLSSSSISYNYAVKGQCKYIKLWRGNRAGQKLEQLREMLPCYTKKATQLVDGNSGVLTTYAQGTAGMYDLVENKFYTNKGTGTFTVGPDL